MTKIIKLNLGSGTNYKSNYINVDIRPEVYPDVVWDLEKFPYPWADDLVNEVLLENTIEHISYRKHDEIYREVYRILKPGGVLVVVTPDVEALYDEFIKDNDEYPEGHARFEHFLFGGHEHEYDYHKAGYTLDLLCMRLRNAEFIIGEKESGMRVEAVKPHDG